MGEAPSPAPALWDWDYLDHCFARHRVCISFGLWICAFSCWIAVHALLLYLRCGKKSGRDQSALCAACCLLTSLCDTIGAILAKQLTIQVFTGVYLAAVDLVSFVSILFPVCSSKVKSSSGRGSRERKRRRQLRASIFALVLPLSLGPGWALWAAVPKASGPIRGPQRRLLGSLVQDNTEILGFLLGGIAALGAWASRIPSLSRICRGRTFPSIYLWTRLLSALAGLLYASAIVAHDRRPEYLLRATPWFLTSLGRAALDLAIIFLSWVMKSKLRHALGFASEARENADTQALLTCAEKEEENQEARTENSDWVPLTTLPYCKPLKRMAAVSRYLELTIEPVQQASCSATRLPGDGQTSTGATSLQEPPSYPPVQVIRACVSSSSSSQVSSINSDLEQNYWEALNSEQWDPEDVNLGGNKDNMEIFRPRVHRWSMKPVDLTSDK
ncbi:transmembrane protein 44 isoform X3 [Delphinus delphis]|uniref:Transmembrane protein 44 isoform X1 n=1 Tax=Tursiops truncatus TaxID=9739 RepID=A0A6J3RA93_TURTR|nr:transmembrane protein 44 isoform X1 [Tursiops truncatus]XP_059865925.1 transmembrane protein 44 isoform X3 [Delphinus delphis]